MEIVDKKGCIIIGLATDWEDVIENSTLTGKYLKKGILQVQR